MERKNQQRGQGLVLLAEGLLLRLMEAKMCFFRQSAHPGEAALEVDATQYSRKKTPLVKTLKTTVRLPPSNPIHTHMFALLDSFISFIQGWKSQSSREERARKKEKKLTVTWNLRGELLVDWFTVTANFFLISTLVGLITLRRTRW